MKDAKILETPSFFPREIVSELDRNIIGQKDAKRAVAIALRNRWRRMQLDSQLQEEVYPKNILMIGPTGVGKTEIARRLAKLAQAPFVKVEATKFTEVGYVGKDVESIIRDLVEVGLHMTREKMRKSVQAQAEIYAEDRVLDALVGEGAGESTRASFREKLRKGELNDREIELDLADNSNPMGGFMDIPGMPGTSMSMVNLGDILGKGFGGRTKRKKLTVSDSYELLMNEESDKLLDDEKVTQQALALVQQNGIVFIDEIDKIAARQDVRGGDVSREGVQRDLLPLIEGTTVSTKYGAVKTDHILFIASGAFHYAKPSDLLAELQGRLPIRVELRALTQEDFKRILTETDACLIRQYKELIATEGVTLNFTDDAVDEIARLAFEVNESVENIGARRLLTVMEKLLDDISYTASDRSGETITIDAAYVLKNVSELAKNSDLSKFIL
jgi:ATP-dependent HslUV protease ATP-binding subunit HslU